MNTFFCISFILLLSVFSFAQGATSRVVPLTRGSSAVYEEAPRRTLAVSYALPYVHNRFVERVKTSSFARERINLPPAFTKRNTTVRTKKFGNESIALPTSSKGVVGAKMPWMLPGRYNKITTGFLERGGAHIAVDIPAPPGTVVRSPVPAVVTISDKTKLNGNRVAVVGPHQNKLYRFVGIHGTRRLVRKGQRVRAGQPIMTVGNTGFSDGSHLHLQVHQQVGGRWVLQNPKHLPWDTTLVPRARNHKSAVKNTQKKPARKRR